MTKAKPDRLWTASFIFLMIINIVNFTGFGKITPQIPRFAVSLGATLAAAGLIVSVFSFFALVGRPFASALGDRLNKKHLLIIALILNGLLTITHALVPGLVWLIPLRVMHGLVFSVSSTLAIALAIDFVPKSRLGEGVGFLGLGNIIGMALGPNIGIIIVDNFSFQVNFLASGLVVMTVGLILMLLKYEPQVSKQESKENPEKKRFNLGDLVALELLPNAAFVALFMLGTGLINSFLVMMGYERAIVNIGIFFLVNSIFAILTRPYIGRLVDRKGVAFVILPGFIFAAAGMVTIAFATSLWHLLIAAMLFSIGAGCGMPALQADCLKRLDPSKRTVATGTYLIGLDIGMIIGPMLGGLVTGLYGFTVTYSAAGVLLLIGFVVYFFYSRKTNTEMSKGG